MTLPERGKFVELEEVRLHLVDHGDPEGEPVLLLHGFPEFWYGWRHQLPPLAEAGFRCLALDQRGYNRSDAPSPVRAYALERLVSDVEQLLDAVGLEGINLVGHDWGGAVAWWMALTRPERVRRLAVLNLPHPGVFREFLASHPTQLLRSWYVFLFQLPRLPERLMELGDGWIPARALRRTSRSGTFTPRALARYRTAWSRPGAWTGMINWYRAALWHPPDLSRAGRVGVPVLLLWGERDRFLDASMAPPSVERCRDGHLEFFPEATHWLHHEEPERVNRRLIDFLA